MVFVNNITDEHKNKGRNKYNNTGSTLRRTRVSDSHFLP